MKVSQPSAALQPGCKEMGREWGNEEISPSILWNISLNIVKYLHQDCQIFPSTLWNIFIKIMKYFHQQQHCEDSSSILKPEVKKYIYILTCFLCREKYIYSSFIFPQTNSNMVFDFLFFSISPYPAFWEAIQSPSSAAIERDINKSSDARPISGIGIENGTAS